MKPQIKEIPPFSFDESSDLPMWVQLRNRMAYLITSGFYKPGEESTKSPSEKLVK